MGSSGAILYLLCLHLYSRIFAGTIAGVVVGILFKWVISSPPWPASDHIARSASPTSKVARIVTVIKMQLFCGGLEAVLALAVPWIGVMLFHLIQQLSICIVTFPTSRMSTLPSVAQNFIGRKRQKLVAIATKTTSFEAVIIDPPHIVFK